MSDRLAIATEVSFKHTHFVLAYRPEPNSGPAMNSNTDALHIKTYDGRPSLTVLSIDRKRNRAIIFGIDLFLPVFRVLSPLSLITGVQVFKQEKKEGQAQYGILLRVRCGDRVKFGCRSREQAKAISHKIAQHLGLGHHS